MLFRLNEKWSIGVIDTPPQWTLCRRKVVKGVEVWAAVSFCQTKTALRRAVMEKVQCGAAYFPGKAENLAVSREAMAKLADLPDHIDPPPPSISKPTSQSQETLTEYDLPMHFDENGEWLIRIWGSNELSAFQLRNMGLAWTGKTFPGGMFYRQRS